MLRGATLTAPQELDAEQPAGERAPLAYALELLELHPNFHVFPIRPNGKEPAGPWTVQATNDPDRVRHWLTSPRYRDCNYGVAAEPSGLVIVDLDDKNGKRGSDEFVALCPDGHAPDTLTVLTPSGGRHLYFAGVPVQGGTDKLASGVDVKSAGGYVVGPGSVIDGRRYSITAPGSPVSVPDFLSERLASAQRERPARHLDHTELSDDARAAAIQFLEGDDGAVQGAGGDEHTYRVAARLLDFGMDQDTAVELLEDHWNHKCAPPWLPAELAAKVRNAWNYRQKPVGDDAAQAQLAAAFADLGVEPASGGPRLLFAPDFYRHRQTNFSSRSIIEGQLKIGAVATIHGPPGHGKTHLAVHLAKCLTTGEAFLGRWPIKTPASVVYVAAEDPDDVAKRLLAAGADNVAVLVDDDGAFSFSNLVWAIERLQAIVTAMLQRRPGRPVVVILDTMRQVLGNRSVMDEGQMNAMLSAVKAFVQRTDVTVIFVHHTNRSDEYATKGGSLEAATTVEYTILRSGDKAGKQSGQRRRRMLGPGATSEPSEVEISLGKNRYGPSEIGLGSGRIVAATLDDGTSTAIFEPTDTPVEQAVAGLEDPEEVAAMKSIVDLLQAGEPWLAVDKRTKDKWLPRRIALLGNRTLSGARLKARCNSIQETLLRLEAKGKLKRVDVPRLDGGGEPRKGWALADGYEAAEAVPSTDSLVPSATGANGALSGSIPL